MSIIDGKAEHYVKSNCSVLFIPDQTPDTPAIFVRLHDEWSVQIRNHTVIADCVTLISVGARKKVAKDVGSVLS